jgi:hypothetical protein
MRKRCSVFALTIVFAAAACGGKGKDDGAKGGGEGGLASCNSPKFNECKQYNQANRALGDDMLKKLCVDFEGTFATVGCATADRVGACKKDEGTNVFYKGHLMPPADLESMCTSTGGVWQKP